MAKAAAAPALRLMDWARLRVRLVWAYEGPPVRAHFTADEPPECAVWLLHTGQVDIRTHHHGSTHVTAGHWVILPPDKCGHDFTDDAQIISLRFVAHWPTGEPLYPIDRAVLIPAAADAELERAAQALTRTVHRVFPQLTTQVDLLQSAATLRDHLRLETALGRWFSAFTAALDALGFQQSSISRVDPRVAQALLVLDRYSPSQPLDEAQLAAMVGLSLSQLNRLCTAQIGMTPYNYFQQRRLETARQALVSLGLPVKQVAYMIGFKHSSHFCRWFARLTGHRPSYFRRGPIFGSV